MTESPLEAPEKIMARLKSATAEHHRRAEQRQLQRDMVQGVLPRDTFAAYLGQLLHVHSCLESRLAEQAKLHPALTTVFRPHTARTADLEADLGFYGRPADPANQATQLLLADIDAWADTSPYALLGPLYVLEGSMNGNKYIARSLMKAWSLRPGKGVRYLNPYGADQPAKWAAFRDHMDANDFTPEDEAGIVAAAQRTFDAIAEIADEVSAAVTG